MAEIFISYASASRPQAQRVAEALMADGYQVWRDDELPPHRSYSDVIEERLRAASAVVVLWSAEAARSHWVRAEADLARSEGKLVQLAIDGTLPPLPFNQIQCVQLKDWDGAKTNPEWGKVLAAVGELVGPKKPNRKKAATSPKPKAPLLAVLPFDNLSADPELIYFSDGVSEEILQTVAQTTSIRVLGRSSSFQFRGADKTVRRLAEELNATHVLDGSVRKSGDQIRISAHLIDCETQTTQWSSRFDRQLSDIFKVQDEIAAAVAQALKATFEPSSQVGAIDPAAYELYLRARTQSPGRDGQFNVRLLREAVTRAPTFGQAWAALAYALASQARYATDPEVSALHAEAREAAERSLALDPNSGLALAALGYLHAPCGQYAEWEASLDAALRVAPRDPVVLYQASLARFWVGRVGEALAFIDDVIELDPLYAQGVNWRAAMLDAAGHNAEARTAYETARRRWPDFEFLFLNASTFAARQGDWPWVDSMAGEMARLGLDTPLVRNVSDMTDVMRRPPEAARAEAVRRLEEELAATGGLRLSSLVLTAALGARDEAYSAADKVSFDHLFRPGAHPPSRDISVHVLFSRQAADLRADPRFVRLCARLGLAAHWLATGRWPDFGEEVAELYDLKAECARLAGRTPPAGD